MNRLFEIRDKMVPSQYQQTEVDDFVLCLLEVCDGVLDTLKEMLEGYGLISKKGVALDNYGSILGVHRYLNETDENFAYRIELKQIVMRATGTIDSSLGILRDIVKVYVEDFTEYDGNTFFYISNDFEARDIERFLKVSRPAGGHYMMVYSNDSEKVFSLNPDGDNKHGFHHGASLKSAYIREMK